MWHPGRDAAERAAAFFARLGKAGRAGAEVDTEALKKLEDVARDLVAALERYGPHRLTLYQREGLVFSEPMEFLHELIAGERLPMPLVHGPIGPALYTNRLIFGREALEIRGAGGSRYAGMLGLKEYPASTSPACSMRLLSLPFELDRVPILRIPVEGRRKDGPHPQAEPAAVVERPRGEPDRRA